MEKIAKENSKINKTELAKTLGVSRSMIYYQHKKPAIDEEIKKQIEAVLGEHHSYGHKRIALELGLNKKRILRVMKKYKIKPYRGKIKRPRKKDDEGRKQAKFENLLKNRNITPQYPNHIWVGDFTYLKYHEKFIYLATVMDLFTREIVGWYISRYHTKELVCNAFLDATGRANTTPEYFHSDQGSEYDSKEYINLAKLNNVKISMSNKSSPWENGHQESFYGRFKEEFGDFERFETLGELIEAVHQAIHYYNRKRIHTTLKMPPTKYKIKFNQENMRKSV
jgi:putative transposase